MDEENSLAPNKDACEQQPRPESFDEPERQLEVQVVSAASGENVGTWLLDDSVVVGDLRKLVAAQFNRNGMLIRLLHGGEELCDDVALFSLRVAEGPICFACINQLAFNGRWYYMWVNGESGSHRIKLEDGKYTYVGPSLDVGELVFDGEWFVAMLKTREGDHFGIIRLKEEDGCLVSNFRVHMDDTWGIDIIATRNAPRWNADVETYEFWDVESMSFKAGPIMLKYQPIPAGWHVGDKVVVKVDSYDVTKNDIGVVVGPCSNPSSAIASQAVLIDLGEDRIRLNAVVERDIQKL